MKPLALILLLIAACAPLDAYSVCKQGGDWLETPYCGELARIMNNV